MISKKEFISWIEKEIMPQLKEVENTKLKWLLLFKHNIIKMTIISVILFIFGVIFEILVCILPFCFLLILCLLGSWQAKIYQKKSKKRFLSPILSKFNLRPISSEEIPFVNVNSSLRKETKPLSSGTYLYSYANRALYSSKVFGITFPVGVISKKSLQLQNVVKIKNKWSDKLK